MNATAAAFGPTDEDLAAVDGGGLLWGEVWTAGRPDCFAPAPAQ